MKKVIIFTETKVGEGHYQAAKALESAFKLSYGDRVEVQIVSGLRCIHPFLEWLSVQAYFCMIKFFPKLWKWLYTGTHKSSFIQTYLFGIKIFHILKQERPDIVLCTHPTCIPGLSNIKKKNKYQFKLGVITTDFDFHPFVITPYVDLFFVPNEHVKRKMSTQYGINPDKIYDYGIPLHPDFELGFIREQKNVIPFKNKKLIQVLVLGGSTGFGPIEEIIEAFSPFQEQFKLTVITGRNKKLYNKLRKLHAAHVRVLGYVTNMKDWLRYADIIISKPGGLTISEAIACGTPFLMIHPIPGHEEANQKYLEEKGLGISVKHIPDLPYRIYDLMQDRENLHAWKQRIKQEHKMGAAEKIVQTIVHV